MLSQQADNLSTCKEKSQTFMLPQTRMMTKKLKPDAAFMRYQRIRKQRLHWLLSSTFYSDFGRSLPTTLTNFTKKKSNRKTWNWRKYHKWVQFQRIITQTARLSSSLMHIHTSHLQKELPPDRLHCFPINDHSMSRRLSCIPERERERAQNNKPWPEMKSCTWHLKSRKMLQ